jgi:tagaturonate reductase
MFLQFGTSRFLQAHADLIISEAMSPHQICVVQSSGHGATAGRLAHLADPAGYLVIIQGRADGATVAVDKTVTSVRRALSSATDWSAVVQEALSCRFILSNVSEAGYAPKDADAKPVFDNAMSFVAKLTLLLKARFTHGVGPCTIMPLELFPDNGTHLQKLVHAQASLWNETAEFHDVIDAHLWVNSLVDRIVSEPIDPVGAVAEPYCLWAIEDAPGLDLPFSNHAAVTITTDLKTFERLKLYLLNLSHTFMAELWTRRGMPDDMLVKTFINDAILRAELTAMVEAEVLPILAAAGLGAQAQAYFATTLERFMNPFLNHKFRDITLGHAGKVNARAGSFLTWARSVDHTVQTPLLDALLKAHNT